MHRLMHRAAAILAGCLLATGALAERPHIPNSVKYKDSSIPTAHGRSGSASIEARALLGKDGLTVIDVTTGSLDGGAAPGSLEKVQVKIPTGGDPITLNYNGLAGGGRFSTTVEEAMRGDTLGLQASVTGIDPNRTDVVSVAETVKLRPDLAVLNVMAAPHALVGMPASIAATVIERNGDIGARADCVLYANDVELRRAAGIWVDAGGTVTCSFSATFDAAGQQQLRVAVEQVSPGDYDSANNSGSAQTQVYASATEMPEWWTNAYESTDYSSVTDTTSTTRDHRESNETRQMGIVQAVIQGPMNMQTLAVTGSLDSDGQVLYALDQIETEWSAGPPWWNGPGWVRFTGESISGEAIAQGMGANQVTTVTLRRVGGDVTYHQDGYEPSGSGYYTWNITGSYSHGPIVAPFGETVSMKLAVSDGTQMWTETDSHMVLEPYSNYDVVPLFCFTRRGRGEVCHEHTIISNGRFGYDDQTRH
jgi:hypothetical protein